MPLLDKLTTLPRNFDPLRFSPPPQPAPVEPRRSPEERRKLIEEAAYYRAQQRHFLAGHELDDWLAAEAEVDRRLALAAPDKQRAE